MGATQVVVLQAGEEEELKEEGRERGVERGAVGSRNTDLLSIGSSN
jgi:hypothetical protein